MADEGVSNEETQLTFNVKSSSDAKHVISISGNSTVADLKTKLSGSDYADIPASRQRLIYSGRVLKDQDTLSSYKIKDGHTVHLVKGAESNQRQDPANQGGTATGSGTSNPASNVPTNIAAGTGANNPLAHLTGARYAGFHQLPGQEMFGADGGMGAPPDPDQLLRLLEDPNFAQQMNEAMNNPAVLNMMRQNPMMRNNPMVQQVLENPELRRMMFDPAFIRMQMNMQRQMGGGAGGNSGFPAPGVTDTTQGAQTGGANNTGGAGQQQNPFAMLGGLGGPNASGANPFAALFGGNPGAAQGTTPAVTPPVGSAGQGTPAQAGTPGTGNTDSTQQGNPFANLFGGMGGGQGGSDPMAEMTRTMMQNPEMMRNVMNMMGGMNGGQGGEGGGAAAANPYAGMFNPALLGGAFGGQQQAQQPPDNRPPEERYAEQLRQLNDMGFYEFERNVRALRMSGGSVQGAIEHLLSGA